MTKRLVKVLFSIVGCSICTIVGSQTKERKTFLKIYYNSMPGKVYLITKIRTVIYSQEQKKLRKIQKIVMVAVISKTKSKLMGQCVGPRLRIKQANKKKTFGSGKKIKSTAGHARPGMSLSGLPWPAGRDVLVQYYPWFIHWFLVNYTLVREQRHLLATFYTTTNNR